MLPLRTAALPARIQQYLLRQLTPRAVMRQLLQESADH